MYPGIRPFATEFISVGDGHELYLEQSGTPGGTPVVFLHGGPGIGCEPAHRQFFDPEKYHIVLFDQRGAGKSRPHAGLEANTTTHLVQDLEVIREHLGIDKWVVFGGSWGSTLALAYAEQHPEKVAGLILRGIFLCRDEDVKWFYQEGTSRLFPDYWQDFIEPIPVAQRHDMIAAYYKLLTGKDELARMKAAVAWSVWEGRTAKLRTDPAMTDQFGSPFLAMAMARIECHYFVNQSFMAPNQLLRDAHLLNDIPITIVHGRYDVICPVDQAFALKQALPHAKLVIVPDAGHSAFEKGNAAELIKATDMMARLLA